LNAPCTLFLCGLTLRREAAACRAFKRSMGRLADFQQHTYTHLRLKTVCEDTGEKITVYPGGTLRQIRSEVRRASAALRDVLGVRCLGLTGPWGYYRGLADRPDILEVLHDEGIRFTRTYARNARDYCPVPWDVQPFWYAPQGRPDMLELPIQGWIDCLYRGRIGWEDLAGYVRHVKRGLDTVARRYLTWGYVQHDWSSIQGDPEMAGTRAIIEHARRRGIEIRTYLQEYRLRKRR